MKRKPFIKLFKTAHRYFLYDVNKNTILKISKETYYALSKVLKYGAESINKEESEVQDYLLLLEKDGYLKPNNIETIKNPNTDFHKSYLHNKMISLILEVTQNCNFRCKYCPYSSDEIYDRTHNRQNMTLEMAKKAIDFYFENSVYVPSKQISFYGGEPLLVFPLIKQCVEYVNSKCCGECVQYNLTTNASLLTEEMVKFFSRHNFKITISLDGWQEHNDKNRKFEKSQKSTFEVVYEKIKMIEACDEYPIDMNFNAVWDGSVPKSEIINFFENDTILKKYSYEINPMSGNSVNNYFSMSENDILNDKYNTLQKILFANKKENFEDEFEYLLERLSDKTNLQCSCHHAGPCIAGQSRLYITTDGYMFPCEKFSRNSICTRIGHLEQGFEYDKIYKLLNFGLVTEKECKNCWAIRLCSMCPVFANGTNELSHKLKTDYCTLLKKQILDDLKSLCAYKSLKEYGVAFMEEK